MSELERRIKGLDAEHANTAVANAAKANAARQLSDKRAIEFLGMMRSRGIGATALWGLENTRNVTVGSFWKGYRSATAFSYEPIGHGWLISSGPRSHYESTPTNWMVMDEKAQAPKVVLCSPPLHELPLIDDKSQYGPPETPFAVLRGNDLQKATVPTPFANERQYEWLVRAASELINQQR